MLSSIHTLEDYLGRYAKHLGQQAAQAVTPLHRPESDLPSDVELLREPFPAQGHVIAAAAKALQRQKSVSIVAEMGTGKTLIAIAAFHAHAAGRPYRALVFCPPHLVEKWQREIKETAPMARVRPVGRYKSLVHLRSRPEPEGAEWWVVSQSDAKLGPGWRPAVLWRTGQAGWPHCPSCYARLERKCKETGRMLPVELAELEKKRTACDNCGQPLWQWTRDFDRWPVAAYVHKQLKGVFDYLVVDECFVGSTHVLMHGGAAKRIDSITPGECVASWDGSAIVPRRVTRTICRVRRGRLLTIRLSNGDSVTCTANHKFYVGGLYVEAHRLKEGDRLVASEMPQLRRDLHAKKASGQSALLRQAVQRDPSLEVASLSLANDGTHVAKAVRVESVSWAACDDQFVYDLEIEGTHCYFAEGVLVSNCHEEKSDSTAQGEAFGTLAAASKKVMALTGTIIGGYAEHVRAILYRTSPQSLIAEGLAWTDHMAFNERYGRIERKVTTKEKFGRGRHSLRTSRGSSVRTQKYVRPGVMPTLFGRHLIGNTIFLSLDEVAADLPPLIEDVIPIAMDGQLAAAYGQLEQTLSAIIKQMLARGNKKLLGTMLHTLLGYPDHPYGWGQIGYYEKDLDSGARVWVPVCDTVDLDQAVIRAKERAMVDAVQAERDSGRQAWVFGTMTNKRDVLARLELLLLERGLRVAVLRSKVKTTDREAWIATHGRKCDVILSHPELVETGLDLFDKGGGHNFATLMWYLTGYNTFTLRQASRRAWRIAQRLECRVKYFYYAGTMQERAMTLMGQKLTASQTIEGRFTTEGLAAMAGEEASMETQLAASLVEKMQHLDALRAWKKVAQHAPAPVLPAPMPAAMPRAVSKQLSLFA